MKFVFPPTAASSITSFFFAISVTPAFSANPITGLPDLDSDGDGDPVGSFVPVFIDTGAAVLNQLGLQASASTDYWVSDRAQTPWEFYVRDDSSDDYLGAHVTEALSAGDTYFYRQSYAFAINNLSMGWRETNALFPTGTQLSFGFSDNGSAATIPDWVKVETINITQVGGGTTTTAPSGFSSSHGSYSWYNYTVDAQGSEVVFDIKSTGREANSNIWSTGDIVVFVEFPDQATLTANGEPMPGASTWALSGYDAGGTFGSVTPGDTYYDTPAGSAGGPALQDDPTSDFVFAWTVDNKARTGGTANTNFVSETIPEPGVSLLGSLSILLLTLRRRGF